MRIVHLITRLILGGAQQTAIALSDHFAKQGHDVTLAYGPIYGPEGSMLNQARETGAKLVELKHMKRSVRPWGDALAKRELIQLFENLQPDLVHTHSSKAGILGRLAATPRVPAVVHTIHGASWHPRQLSLINRLYISAERKAAKACHHLVAVTPAMRQEFVDQAIAPPDKITVIPSGIDVSRFQTTEMQRLNVRQQLGIPEDAPVLGLVARFDPLKGHDDLLQLMPWLLKRFPDLRLIFIGDGWNRPHIEAHIRRHDLGERVILTGLVEEEEVPRLLAAVDVKALPSYQEGQSRTLPEAILCGCAVVGYDAGGIGAIIKDGQTGRLVPIGDVKALGDAIADLLGDAALRAKLVEQGKQHVLEQFDQQHMFEMHDALYHSLMRDGG